MKLQLCFVFLFLSLKGSYSTISSYPSPGDGWSYLCGCGSRNQHNNNIQMKCKDDHVIQMEPGVHFMRESVGKFTECGNLNFTTCKTPRPDVSPLQDRIEVYKRCSFKNSCDIKIAGVEEGKQRFMNYPFYCHSMNDVHDISMKRDMSHNKPIFYLIGEHHTGHKIDCDCVFTGPAKVLIEIYFIHLKPTSCSKVRFLSRNVQLFGCNTPDTTILHFRYYYVKTEFKVEIRDMEPDKEDVLFVRFWGYEDSMSVNCGGCSKTRVTSTPKSEESTTGRRTTHPLITDNPSTARPTTDFLAPIYPSTDNPSNVNPTKDSSNTLNNVYAMFGGIIAALIIINLLGIGIYCCIRKRKNTKKLPNAPIPTVSSSNDYAAFHYPIGTDHHYQDLMDYKNCLQHKNSSEPDSQL